jgi:hypothetical protein
VEQFISRVDNVRLDALQSCIIIGRIKVPIAETVIQKRLLPFINRADFLFG